MKLEKESKRPEQHDEEREKNRPWKYQGEKRERKIKYEQRKKQRKIKKGEI